MYYDEIEYSFVYLMEGYVQALFRSFRRLQYCNVLYAARGGYRRISIQKSETVLLWCNTTRSGKVNWIHTMTDGRSVDVYINGRFEYDGYNRFSIVEHSLNIYNAQVRDSGSWNCYDSSDVRRFGYELNVTGKQSRVGIIDVATG